MSYMYYLINYMPTCLMFREDHVQVMFLSENNFNSASCVFREFFHREKYSCSNWKIDCLNNSGELKKK